MPFAAVAAGWLVAGGLVWVHRPGAVAWHVVFWAASILDLYVLVRAIQAVFKLVGTSELQEQKNRAPLVVQAFYWGAFKLACVGIFIGLLNHTAGSPGVITGLATLAIVPFFGGFWWSQRALRDGK